MRMVKRAIVALILTAAFSFTAVMTSSAKTGGMQPGPTPPPPKLSPDLKIENFYFDSKCNLMVKVKNIGPGKFIGPMTGWRIFMNGEWAGSATHSLTLLPNSTATFLTLNSGILGVWVKENKNWQIRVNEAGHIQGSSAKYVEESNNSNNTMTKFMKCNVFSTIQKQRRTSDILRQK